MPRPRRELGVGLLKACDSKQLFGFPLYPRQREVLGAVESGGRLHVWALGRRSGKTTMAALVGLWCCLLRPELRKRLRPGERGYAVGVATNLRQARLLVRAALSIVERSPALRGFIESVSEDEICFANGTGFAAFPCSSRGGRGWPVFCLLMDEAAHFLSDTDGPQVADRVFEALMPATAQFGDDARVIVSSSPWGSEGLFARLWQQVDSGEVPGRAWRLATADMNPTITEDFLAAEERRDPESFRSEYLAEFVGSGAAYLDPDAIAACVVERGELAPEYGVRWVAGLDPAFSHDPFGLALVGRDPWDRRRLVLGLARSWSMRRWSSESFEVRRRAQDEVLSQVADVCRRYRARVVTDQYAAPAIVDRLRREGLSVRSVSMSVQTRTDAFAELRARVLSHSIELYEHPELLAELRRLRTKFTAGSSMVVNPRVGGAHGDMAQALALAVYEHDRGGLGGEVHWADLGGEPAAAVGLADRQF
jgi:hypothetical protein